MSLTPQEWMIVGAAFILGVVIVSLVSKSKLSSLKSLMLQQVEHEKAKTKEVELRLGARDKELDGIRKQTVELKQSEAELKTRLEVERKAGKEKELLLQKAQVQLGDTFKALSSDALKASQKQFLQLAESSMKAQQEKANLELDKRRQAVDTVVKPISDGLEKMQGRIQEIEKAREGAYASITEQVKGMAESQINLQKETSQLVKALRQPTGRGQWGEMQLRRVVEMSGMQEHCDFSMQVNTTTDEGKNLRPDLVVNLPGGQQIVVDSKTPMSAYLDAIEAVDEEKTEELLEQHARQVRIHIQDLGSKKYQDQFETSPEFVVLFLPSEAFFSAALAKDSELIEKGVDKGVILATPTTLIALLRAVAYGWRQQALTDNAQKISLLGKELHGRIVTFTDHFAKVGANLNTLVGNYNKAVGSLDTRVISSAKKFGELGAVAESSEALKSKPVEAVVRQVSELPEPEWASKTVETGFGGFDSGEDFVGFAD